MRVARVLGRTPQHASRPTPGHLRGVHPLLPLVALWAGLLAGQPRRRRAVRRRARQLTGVVKSVSFRQHALPGTRTVTCNSFITRLTGPDLHRGSLRANNDDGVSASPMDSMGHSWSHYWSHLALPLDHLGGSRRYFTASPDQHTGGSGSTQAMGTAQRASTNAVSREVVVVSASE